MLSEVIHSRFSYSAVPLAGQQIDQRSVHFGPLVANPPISRSADYIFTFLQNGVKGWRITHIVLSLKKDFPKLYGSHPYGLSRYGVCVLCNGTHHAAAQWVMVLEQR